MNKKAQFGNLYLMFVFIVIGLIYFTGIAPIVGEVGRASAINLTGIDKFFYENLNLFITFFYCLGVMAIAKFTG